MDTIKLSVCIPTRNYGRFIGQCLQSIINQATDGLEIVVVDGGSTDNTQRVVSSYKSKFPALRYFYLERAMGIDNDLATAVTLARGQYCWLFSADDVLRPGAMWRILREIDLLGLDIYLCNRVDCDLNLNPTRDRFWLDSRIDDRIFNLSDREGLLEYLRLARSLGALFSYISSIIVSRQKWDSVQVDSQFIGTNYTHVHKLFSILIRGGQYKYIKQPLVLTRGGNDSFLESSDKGIVKRYLIDFNGYLLLGQQLFRDKKVRDVFFAVMRHEHRWFMLTRLATRVTDDLQWKSITTTLGHFGYTIVELYLINIFRQIEFSFPILKLIRKIKHDSTALLGVFVHKLSLL